VLRAALKSLLGRKLRLILTAFSVVLGVGFVAGTYVLTDTMNAAFEEVFAQTSEGVDVVVRSTSSFDPIGAGPGGGGGTEGRNPVPEELVATVAALPDVAEASGDVQGYAQMIDPATGEVIGGVGPPTIGVNWTEQATSVLEIRSGQPPAGPDDVLIDAGTANRYDLQVGDRIRILFEGPPGEFTIVGIAGFGEADNLAGATLAVFDPETAQRVLGKEGVYDSISLVGAEGVAPTQLRASVQAALPDGYEALTSEAVGDEAAEALGEALGFFQTALLVFALIALFVGGFIIFNTFSIIVAQRTKELALLRAIGASRRQVVISVVVEALAIGLVASAVGIVAGIGIAIGLQGLLGAFGVDLPSTTTQVLPRTIVVALVVGTVVTVVSSVLPARRAGRVPPIEALRESQDTGVAAGFGKRLAIGAVVTALAIVALMVGLFGGGDNAGIVIGVGAAGTFIGIAMLSPLVARPLAQVIGAVLAGVLRVVDVITLRSRRGANSDVQRRLGRENAMRNPRRTASTASALMIGLGLVAMVSILSASLKASLDVALQAALRADLTLMTQSFTPFSPEATAAVRALPEAEAVAAFRQGGFRWEDSTEFITAVEPATVEAVATMDVTAGSLDALNEPDTVLIYVDRAEDQGWSVGDRITVEFATVGETELTIAGIFAENRVVGGNFVVSLDTYQRYFTERLDAWAMVELADGVSPEQGQAALEAAVADFPNVQVQDQAAFREQQAAFVDQLLNLVTALLSMAVLIALFGIANTLGLSIFERTRELGLLRAVGMSRSQVRRMIRWEAVIIAVLGALLGLAIGVFFGWALQQALEGEGVTELAIPGGQLAGYVVFAAIAGVLTAIGPARRASRLNVLESIAYE
jgi:putative ABC transport system permease protein